MVATLERKTARHLAAPLEFQTVDMMVPQLADLMVAKWVEMLGHGLVDLMVSMMVDMWAVESVVVKDFQSVEYLAEHWDIQSVVPMESQSAAKSVEKMDSWKAALLELKMADLTAYWSAEKLVHLMVDQWVALMVGRLAE